MTEELQQAFQKAAELPEPDQLEFATWMLEELESEQRWQKLFSESQDMLDHMAREARAEHARGETELLDPDKL